MGGWMDGWNLSNREYMTMIFVSHLFFNDLTYFTCLYIKTHVFRHLLMLRGNLVANRWCKLYQRYGARCSSVVRAFAQGVMGHRIDPSWWTHWAISRSSQCSTTGVIKAMVCVNLSVG